MCVTVYMVDVCISTNIVSVLSPNTYDMYIVNDIAISHFVVQTVASMTSVPTS